MAPADPHVGERLLLVEGPGGPARGALERWPGPLALAHAGTLSDACAFLRAERVDAVVADLALPDGHGVEVVADVAAAAPGVAVVVLAGPADESLAVDVLSAGAQFHVPKDRLEPGALAAVVRSAIALRGGGRVRGPRHGASRGGRGGLAA